MAAEEPEQGFLGRLISWARQQELVRAVLLTSTRASPIARVDVLSDYDMILYVSDPDPFRDFDAWLSALGPILLGNTPDQHGVRGLTEYRHGVFFDDMTKADFTIAPVAGLDLIRAEPRLPPGFDLGYRVLLDKDNRTVGMPAPTYTAFVPAKPTAQQYRTLVEEFWFCTAYVAKCLWRDE